MNRSEFSARRSSGGDNCSETARIIVRTHNLWSDHSDFEPFPGRHFWFAPNRVFQTGSSYIYYPFAVALKQRKYSLFMSSIFSPLEVPWKSELLVSIFYLQSCSWWKVECICELQRTFELFSSLYSLCTHIVYHSLCLPCQQLCELPFSARYVTQSGSRAPVGKHKFKHQIKLGKQIACILIVPQLGIFTEESSPVHRICCTDRGHRTIRLLSRKFWIISNQNS